MDTMTTKQPMQQSKQPVKHQSNSNAGSIINALPWRPRPDARSYLCGGGVSSRSPLPGS